MTAVNLIAERAAMERRHAAHRAIVAIEAISRGAISQQAMQNAYDALDRLGFAVEACREAGAKQEEQAP